MFALRGLWRSLVLAPTTEDSDSPYFCGPVGWGFTERNPLKEALEIRGKQGIWEIDNDLLLAHLGLKWCLCDSGSYVLLRGAHVAAIAEKDGLRWKASVQHPCGFGWNQVAHSVDDLGDAIKVASEEAILLYCGAGRCS
jgi:hypothetical protein